MKNTRIILALLFVLFSILGGLIWHISQHQWEMIHSSSLRTAKLYSVALTQFRNIYTSEIVEKAKHMGLDIAHNYASRDDAIPLPAALTMRMAEEIGKSTSGAKARLYSPHPFSLKEKGSKASYGHFENNAWDFLLKNPGQVYTEFEKTGIESHLHYATADIMQEQCVACHNSHPDSPKKDWKVGDVAGVLIVNLPLGDIVTEIDENLKNITIIYFAIGFGLVLIVGFVVIRLRKQTQKTQRDRDFSQGLLDTAPVIVLLLDTHGCIEYVNPYFEKLCGYKINEIKGKEWISTFLPERDQDRVRELLQSSEQGKQVDGNINPIVCRNKKEHQIEWYARTMRDDTGEITGVLSIGQDITEHKIADDKLRETSQLLDNIIENVPDTIFLKCASDLRYEYFNRAAESLLGLDRTEMIGRNDYDLFPKEQADFFVEKDREVFQQHGVVNIPEEFIETPNGTRTMHTKKIALRDEHGNPQFLLGISEDITDRLHIEQSFIKNEERLNEAQRLAKVGSWELEIQTNHLVWSEEIFRIFEIDKELFNASYDAFLDAIHPADRDMVNKSYTDSLSDRLPYEIRHRLKMKDGRIKHVIETCETFFDDEGEPLRSVGTVQDISELNKAEIEIEQSRTRFEAIFESIPDAIVYVDPDRKIQMVNSATIHIFGYEETELIGNQTKMLYASPEVFMEQGKRRFNPNSDATHVPYEVMYRCKNGREFTGETLGIPVKSSNREVLGYLGIIRDVTERKLTETELLKYREHLEELVQERTSLMKDARDESLKANQAKSEFLTRMSHELRTPMNAILGFGQMLELDAEGFSETQRSNVQEILDASRHLMDLINEVLDLSKIENGKLEITMENVAVDDVIQQSIALIQPLAASRHIELTDHVSGKGHIVQADITRFKQILVNILSNAVKYNRESGYITLDSELIDEQHLRISVTDTGEGLTEDEITRLFSPFDRLNNVNNVEGTGIGLVITKHLAELMGGTIGVESTPGEGSTFWVELELTKNV